MGACQAYPPAGAIQGRVVVGADDAPRGTEGRTEGYGMDRVFFKPSPIDLHPPSESKAELGNTAPIHFLHALGASSILAFVYSCSQISIGVPLVIGYTVLIFTIVRLLYTSHRRLLFASCARGEKGDEEKNIF